MRQYYDSLFQDLEGTALYAAFIKKYACGKTMLEFACGTGDLLNMLSETFDVTGVDLDLSMLEKACTKYPEHYSRFVQGNFLTYKDANTYDTIVCVGDSLNYLSDDDELKQFVENASAQSSCIIVDMHHPYRLKEFEESYYEEGVSDTFQYMYVIDSEADHLIHTINFMDGTFDQVLQWVFDPHRLIQEFEAKGYLVSVFTDFNQMGIADIGEKVMLVCKRK